MDYMQLLHQWLVDFADDMETIEDLESIEDDPKEAEDRFYRELEFGTAGMRGVLGAGTNRLNKYNVRRVTRALAKYILTTPDGAQKGVAIAYDSRRKSAEFAKQAALVLCNSGVKVFLFESLRPVPVLSFTVRHLKCIAGIVITASHNPAQYNGYKVYWTDGAQMPPESVKGITERLPDTTYAESLPMDEQEALDKGLLTYIGKDVDDAYIAAIKKLAVNPELTREMGKKLKIGKQKVPGTNQYVYGVEGNDDTNPNRSMLKLSYKDKTGFFSGNFKYYATQKIPSKNGEKLKLKTYSAKICGFMVTDTSDPYGLGYGAPAKNPDFQTWKVYLLTPGTAIIVNP
jgi:hypothetical protein